MDQLVGDDVVMCDNAGKVALDAVESRNTGGVG
jgi:hypothetical protein